MKIKNLALDKIIPYARNPRRNDEAVASVAASIKEYGPQQPIVVDADGVIIVGHTRLKAAQQLALDSFPVTVADGLTAAQVKAYRIADNRVGEAADWNADMLALEIDDLRDMDFDIGLTGFDSVDLDELLNPAGDDQVTDGLTDGDDTPETQEREITKTGDVWVMGDHRLVCGDSTDKQVVGDLLDGVTVNACLTDPPYGINQDGIPNDEPEKLKALINGAVAQIKMTNGVFVAFQSTRTFPEMLSAAKANGFKFERMLWMYKQAQCTFPWRGWILKSEAILVHSIGTPDWAEVNPYAHDCYLLAQVAGEIDPSLGWHGSIKPMSVVSDILTRISNPGGMVYEPFSGSGTTIIAAEMTGRKCCAIEIAPRYVDVAVRRWQEFTGRDALLESDGTTFDQVSESGK